MIGKREGSDRARETDVFAALGNPVRRQILMALRGGARTASELAVGQPIGRPAVSEHLQALRLAGLLVVEKRGRERLYHLDPRRLTEVGAWLNAMLASWTRRLDDLNAIAERRKASS
jgi:DNA-binding transcriptional ArsR family regulator